MEKELDLQLHMECISLLTENGYIHLLKEKIPSIVYQSYVIVSKNLKILDVDLINIELFNIYKKYGLGVRKMENYFFLKETKDKIELVKLSKSSISRLEKKYSSFDSKEHLKSLERLRNSYNSMNMFNRIFNSDFQDFELKEFSQSLNNILSNYVLEQNKRYIIENLKSGKVDLKYQKMYKYKYDSLIYELVKKPSMKRFLRTFRDIPSMKKSDKKLLEQIQKSIIFIKAEETDFKYNYMLSEIYKIAILEDVKHFENTFFAQYIQANLAEIKEKYKKSIKSH
ncbi:MAG: hypothetical protein ACRDCE_19435 [Cetobacterium sp.]|uniref:hypothetical protein n=1 Tax=Cetobacterium sp. TaxID=2071632 RepID=UPI003EE4E619